MKKWSKPEVVEVDIKETAYHLFGKAKDGGFIGDGHLTGHNMQEGHDPSKCEWCSKYLDPAEELS